MIKFCDLTPIGKLRSELDDAYNRVMSSGVYVRGKEVTAFEKEWAAYNDAKYCVSCGSGLDALQLVLRAIDETVISVPEWTATSTWAAVEASGKRIIIRRDYFRRITVHLYGIFNNESRAYDIQDCAQAHGLKLKGTCCWSFYPTKNLGAYGDGGAITTDNEELANKLRLLRNHGCPGAINSRLDPLQAAFLQVKLKYLDSWNKQRQEFASYYLENLKGIPDIILPDAKPEEAVWHQFVIRSYKRDAIKQHLADNGIETMIHYPVPPHQALGYNYDLPYADEMAATVLSLPIAPHLRMEDIKRVVEVLKKC